MELYTRYGPAIMRKCIRMLGSIQDAEDIVQALFMDLLKKDVSKIDLAYLYRASTNRCLNYLRDTKKRTYLLKDRSKTQVNYTVAKDDEDLINRETLEKLISHLDKKSRQIMVYKYFDDMTQEEIAQITGYNRKTVAKKINTIKESIKKIASEQGVK